MQTLLGGELIGNKVSVVHVCTHGLQLCDFEAWGCWVKKLSNSVTGKMTTLLERISLMEKVKPGKPLVVGVTDSEEKESGSYWWHLFLFLYDFKVGLLELKQNFMLMFQNFLHSFCCFAKNKILFVLFFCYEYSLQTSKCGGKNDFCATVRLRKYGFH